VLAAVIAALPSPPELTRTKLMSSIAPCLLPVNQRASARMRISSSFRMMAMGDVALVYSVFLRFELTPCCARVLPTAAFDDARRSGELSARFWASLRNDGTTTIARGVASNCAFVTSPDAVLKTLYTPTSRIARVVVDVLMNDSVSEVFTPA
jgi:hypothetical protein